ncbi:MAG: hypothetical protein SNG79_04435 [Rikenellaceae bacterium]
MKEKKLTPEQMVARIAELEQKLEHEKMHRIVLDTIIDIAERDLNIAIRKKYGAKQSKQPESSTPSTGWIASAGCLATLAKRTTTDLNIRKSSCFRRR